MRDADLLDWPRQASTLATSADTVGWRGQQRLDQATFRRDVAGWQTLLATTPGRRYALFHADSLSFAAALLGAWLAGKTIVLPADALPATCRALQTEVDGFLGQFEPEWQALDAPSSAPSSVPLADIAVPASWLAFSPQMMALDVYTSGSTGAPQAIPKTLAQLANEVATLECLFGARLEQAEIIATVSHQHIYGLLFKVLWPLAAGRAIHAHSAFFPQDLRQMAPPRRWALLASPAHLKRLHEQPVLPATDQLCAVFSSGGPLPAEAARQAHATLGHSPIEVYGSSETGGIAWRNPQPQPERQQIPRDERWHAMPGVELRASDQGLLEVRSPHLPDQAWFAMADRVRIQPDGFTLHGRADRLVKLEEKRISLDRIEQLVLASGLAAEARVLVHTARRQRQREFVAAFVVPTAAGRVLLEQGKPALNTALRTALAGSIEGVALPRLWRYLDALPTNAQGKLTVAALVALLEPATETIHSGPATGAATRPTEPQVRELSRQPDRVVLALHVPQDLLYFDGHFTDAPILPGVVQTDWALRLGRHYFALPPRFVGMQALKFQRVVVPGADVTLELQHEGQPASGRSTLSFTLHSDHGQHASGRFLLEPA